MLQFAVVALFVALTAGVAAHQATQQLVRLAPARPPAARSAAEPGDVHGPGNGAVHGWTEPPDVRFRRSELNALEEVQAEAISSRTRCPRMSGSRLSSRWISP